MSRPFAIVTGASTGIGFELAALAAENGYDLLVVADEPLIDAAAEDFKRFGTDVRSIQADLSTTSGVDQLLDAADGRQIDLVCANAGLAQGHAFLEQRVEDWRRVIDTNIVGTTYLLHRVLNDMVARNDGKVLVTGSIAGYMPGAFMAVYNGTKAYLNSLVAALQNEIRDAEGVTLTNLMPGATDTEIFARADMLDTSVGTDPNKEDPAVTAKNGWDALMAGKAGIVSGFKNKVLTTLANVTPNAMLAEQHRGMAEPGSAD